LPFTSLTQKPTVLHTLFLCLIILCLLISSSAINAQPLQPININSYALETTQTSVTANNIEYLQDPNNIEYLQDPNNIFALAKIHSRDDWQTPPQKDINLGYTQDTIWIRLHINNLQFSNYKPLLQVAYARLDHIEVYRTNDGKNFNHLYTTGDRLPFSTRPINHPSFLFPLHIPEESSSYIYLRIRSDSAMQIPIHLWDERYFLSQDRYHTFGQGLFFGTMAVMLCYNLFLSIATRRKAYLSYSAYIATSTLLISAINGYGYEMLWSNSTWFQDKSSALFLACTSTSVQIFSIHFVGLQALSKRLLQVQKSWLALNVASIAFSLLLPHQTIIFPLICLLLLTAILSYGFGFVMLFQNSVAARYYIIGWSSLIVCSAFLALNKLGLIPYTPFAIYLTQFGMCFEIVLFSFALAEQINTSNRSLVVAKQQAQRNEAIAQEEHQKLIEVEIKANKTEFDAHTIASQAQADITANTDFLATMSHEIRTPMNGVIGMADLLKTTRLTDKQKRYVDTIYHSGEALIAIINDILDLSKIDAGKMSLENSEFNIDELMDQCMSVFALKANEDEIEYFGVVSTNTPKALIGDTTRLRQIILNLLSNAFKFTEKGRVTLTIEPDTDHDETLSRNQTQLRFSITDTGIGIQQDKLDVIFNAYQQEDSGTTRLYGRTGLGLSICKKIAEDLMDGKIGVNSTINQGSTFWFSIPLPYISSSTIAPIANPEEKQHRLLVADFNTPFSKLMQYQADELNLPIEIHQSSTDFIDALKKTTLDEGLILCIGEGFKPSSQAALQEQVSLSPYNSVPGIIIAPAIKSPLTTAMIFLERPTTTPQINRWFHKHIYGKNSPIKTPSVAPKQLFGTQILVAEDNNVNQLVIRSMLESLGANIYIVENGEDAVNHYREYHSLYDLILMDCEMPVMDGYDAAIEIHKTAKQLELDSPIIIALSAHVLAVHREKAKNSGMQDFISKPVMRGKLATCLERNLPKKDWNGFVHPNLRKQDS